MPICEEHPVFRYRLIAYVGQCYQIAAVLGSVFYFVKGLRPPNAAVSTPSPSSSPSSSPSPSASPAWPDDEVSISEPPCSGGGGAAEVDGSAVHGRLSAGGSRSPEPSESGSGRFRQRSIGLLPLAVPVPVEPSPRTEASVTSPENAFWHD